MYGYGSDGRLGIGDEEDYLIPTKLNLPSISQISCGAHHTAFLTKGGEVYICGNGQTGDERNRSVPTKVENLPPISQVSCGDSHTAFLTKGGEVYMCGRGRNGQLGTGDEKDRLIPTKLTFANLALETFPSQALTFVNLVSRVSCGARHTAFLTKRGDVYMCGSGEHGQLGTGDERNRSMPTKVENLPPISQVSCGDSHTAFLTKGGGVYMCGYGTNGQLGTGDQAHRLIPQVLTNLPPISQVNCGFLRTAFVTKGGEVYMCGIGRYGNWEDKLIPTKVELSNLHPISQVSCGYSHIAFLTKSGIVCMCGIGINGQLGTGDRTGKSIPTRITIR